MTCNNLHIREDVLLEFQCLAHLQPKERSPTDRCSTCLLLQLVCTAAYPCPLPYLAACRHAIPAGGQAHSPAGGSC